MQHDFTSAVYYEDEAKFSKFGFLLPLQRMNKDGYIKYEFVGTGCLVREITDEAHS